jgi:hypothetical protein
MTAPRLDSPNGADPNTATAGCMISNDSKPIRNSRKYRTAHTLIPQRR